jgi:hypothetical protein
VTEHSASTRFRGRLLVVVCAICVAAALAPGGGSVAAAESGASSRGARAGSHAASPASLTNFRVCSSTVFSRRQQQCTRNEAGRPIVSNRITCSATLVARRKTEMRARWYYEGRLVYTFSPSTFYPDVHRPWINWYQQTSLPLPGGTWRCEFKAGALTSGITFTSGGPTGTVVNATVCSGERAVRQSGYAWCRSDDGAAPIARTDSVVCGGTFLKVRGSEVVIRLRSESGDELGGTIGTATSPIWNWVEYFGGRGEPFAPGTYYCDYLVDGRVVSTKPFELSPA